MLLCEVRKDSRTEGPRCPPRCATLPRSALFLAPFCYSIWYFDPTLPLYTHPQVTAYAWETSCLIMPYKDEDVRACCALRWSYSCAVRTGGRSIDAAPLRRRNRALSADSAGFEAPALFRAIRRKRVMALGSAECHVSAADEQYFEDFRIKPSEVDDVVDPLSECVPQVLPEVHCNIDVRCSVYSICANSSQTSPKPSLFYEMLDATLKLGSLQ